MVEINQGGGGGRWPYRSWQFWCGLLVGAGVGLMLGAAFVELEWLTPHGKAWVSVLGILVFAGGCAVGVGAGRGRQGQCKRAARRGL